MLDNLVLRRSKSTLNEWLTSLDFDRAPNGNTVIPFYIEPQLLTLVFTKNHITEKYNSVEKYSGVIPEIRLDYPYNTTFIGDRECLEIPCQIKEKSIIYKKEFDDYTNSSPAKVYICISPENRVKILGETDIEKNRLRKLNQHKQILQDWGYTEDQADILLSIGNFSAVEALDWINLIEYNSNYNLKKAKDIIDILLKPGRKFSSNNFLHYLRIAKIRPLPPEYKLSTELWEFVSSAHEILQFKLEKRKI